MFFVVLAILRNVCILLLHLESLLRSMGIYAFFPSELLFPYTPLHANAKNQRRRAQGQEEKEKSVPRRPLHFFGPFTLSRCGTSPVQQRVGQ
jgi:hypothetical protein